MAGDRKERKNELFQQVGTYVHEYKKIIFVEVDNVTSMQMQQIRKALRGQAIVMMGKNTMIKRALRNLIAEKPEIEKILPIVKGNVGFVFTNGDLKTVRDILVANRVAAPARVGAIAPINVMISAGPTGLEPTQTSFLQALDIPSKINKGQVEIVKDVQIIKAGDKVGNSEAQLLNKLNIKPFTYGLEALSIFDDGSVYSPDVLDITDEDILERVKATAANVTAIALGAGYSTMLTVPHSVLAGYKNVLHASVGSGYDFKYSAELKALLADPTKLAAMSAAAAPSAAAPAKKEEVKKEEKKEEEEEADVGMGGLFD